MSTEAKSPPSKKSPTHAVLFEYLDDWARKTPDVVWLRDRKGDELREWTWASAHEEINAVAASLERRFGSGVKMALLSRNRAHWILADYSIIASGNVTIPLFTTLPGPTARYVLEFSETQVLFLGEAENRDTVLEILPDGVTVVCLPGVEIDQPHLRWDDLHNDGAGARPDYTCQPSDLISLVFTSGTTGIPKGVMQTHESTIIPMSRFELRFGVRDTPRFLSYLPLSHIGERHLVECHSLMRHGVVTFNESLPTILRDLQATRPNFFFGPPRVWEQFQQMIIGQFGSQAALDELLATDEAGTLAKVDTMLGLGDSDYNLTAAAPTPPALIEWFGRIGIRLLEGFGQTEAMGLIANTADDFRVGSIGRPAPGVEVCLSEEEELLVKTDGLTPGYYKQPEKTAELYRNGWLHTGDKARVDDNGFFYLTGRLKDYFKTIQGKFVAPAPIEGAFADDEHAEQICLLGRGYSKTVMVCVLSTMAQKLDRTVIEEAMRAQVRKINGTVEKHARIGAVILSTEPWTIENEVLTPTLKIRRERVEARFGETAERLAREGAEQGKLLVEWES